MNHCLSRKFTTCFNIEKIQGFQNYELSPCKAFIYNLTVFKTLLDLFGNLTNTCFQKNYFNIILYQILSRGRVMLNLLDVKYVAIDIAYLQCKKRKKTKQKKMISEENQQLKLADQQTSLYRVSSLYSLYHSLVFFAQYI